MSNSYIGVRVEIVSRIVKTDLCKIVEQYNNQNKSQLFDLHINGKIAIERKGSIIIARGEEDKRKKYYEYLGIHRPLMKKKLE